MIPIIPRGSCSEKFSSSCGEDCSFHSHSLGSVKLVAWWTFQIVPFSPLHLFTNPKQLNATSKEKNILILLLINLYISPIGCFGSFMLNSVLYFQKNFVIAFILMYWNISICCRSNIFLSCLWNNSLERKCSFVILADARPQPTISSDLANAPFWSINPEILWYHIPLSLCYQHIFNR